MSVLMIAEKPSMARQIAAAIDPNPVSRAKQGVGWIETRHGRITWCFGHMLELAPPEHYKAEWGKWTLEHLPIQIPEADWTLRPKPSAEPQINCIRDLLKDATRVIHAGDPDREGQMLVDELLERLRWKGKTDRLMVYDLTPAGVREAMKKIQPNANFANLYVAAMCRARADWLVGMNLTRAATKRLGPKISIGRVQTPTLAMVVRRDLAIEAHVVQTFFTLQAAVANQALTLSLVHDAENQRIFDRSDATRIAKAIEGTTVELSIETADELGRSPLPHTASSFHKEGEKLFGWSAKQAAELLQSLYDQQLVSYPRTDCAYLPSEQAKDALPLAQKLVDTALFPPSATLALAPKDRVYNDSKVEEHHGLTPTRKLPPADLDKREMEAWKLVARRFLASLAPDDRVSVTSVSFVGESRVFKTKGEVPLNREASWLSLFPPKEEKNLPLPRALFAAGQKPKVIVRQVEVKTGKTTPPKPYTEATLREDMSSAAKFVENAALKAMLKETDGIGTASTQPAIIETIKDRGYVVLEGRGKTKVLRSTKLGRYVIKAMPPAPCDAGITAAWELRLKDIAKGAADPRDFMQRIDAFVAKHVEMLRTGPMPELPPDLKEESKTRSEDRVSRRKVLGKKRKNA
jgi:DNA topoisomerase-3